MILKKTQPQVMVGCAFVFAPPVLILASSFFLLSFAFGAVLWWHHRKLFFARAALVRCETEKNVLKERLDSFTRMQQMIDHQIKGVCHNALKESTSQLLARSKEMLGALHEETRGQLSHQKESVKMMLEPFEKTLADMQTNVQAMEKNRAGAYEGLHQQVKGLVSLQSTLHTQTSQLLQALKTPNVRGQWGEIQLRRLVEWSGMLPFCDFAEQQTVDADSGFVRPDLIVRLPGERCVVVDAKAPLHVLLDAAEKRERQSVAKHLKLHIRELGRRNYQRYVEKTPDFVLLFLPAENVPIQALEEDDTIMDECANKGVLLATPMTLIALLKTIALGWRQHSLSTDAQKIAVLAKDLTGHFEHLLNDFAVIGRGLKSASSAYGKVVSKIEDDLLPCGQEMSQFVGTTMKVPRLQKSGHLRAKREILLSEGTSTPLDTSASSKLSSNSELQKKECV